VLRPIACALVVLGVAASWPTRADARRLRVAPRVAISTLIAPGVAVRIVGRRGDRVVRLTLACPPRVRIASRKVVLGRGGSRRVRWRIAPSGARRLRPGRCEIRGRWAPVGGHARGARRRARFVLIDRRPSPSPPDTPSAGPEVSGALHSTPAAPFVTASGAPVTLQALNVVPVWSSDPGNTWAKAHYDRIAAKGFNAVRFVLYWDDFEPASGAYNQTSLRTLDAAIARAKAAGLYVVLDEIHLWGLGGMNDVPLWARTGDSVTSVEANGAAYLKMLAERYRAEAAVAAYDIVNEFYRYPIDQNAVLRVYDELITEVRSVDRAKIVLIEPTYGDTSIAGADFANLTHRDNVVWSIHDYFAGGEDDGYATNGSQAGNYTWDGTSGYPSPDPSELERHLLVHVNAMRLVGIPLWIGEFGIGAGAVGHDRWIDDQVALFRKYGLGRSWWEYHTTGAFSATNSDYTWKPWVERLL